MHSIKKYSEANIPESEQRGIWLVRGIFDGQLTVVEMKREKNLLDLACDAHDKKVKIGLIFIAITAAGFIAGFAAVVGMSF